MRDEIRPDLQPSGPQAALRLTIQRNCSIAPRTLWLLLGATTSVSFGIGIGFAVFGAWVILPFAGLEMVALTAAFYCVSRHAGDYEKFVEEQGALKVEIRDAGRTRAYEFNPHWARLVLRRFGREPRLALRSHGRELEIGRHLPEAGRLELAMMLGQRLSSYQKR
jgi:uncharacterized membrane protein